MLETVLSHAVAALIGGLIGVTAMAILVAGRDA